MELTREISEKNGFERLSRYKHKYISERKLYDGDTLAIIDDEDGTFRVARHEPFKAFVEQWTIKTADELFDILSKCGVKMVTL